MLDVTAMINQTSYMAAGLAAFILLIILCAMIGRRFGKSKLACDIDEMEGVEFEHFCAELLRKRGFVDVEVTRASGDFGVDILAEKEGVTYAIQCKRYNEAVGVKAIQEACAGREYYDCMVGAVMTNQYFTGPAVKAAKKLKILLWDRGYVDEMLSDNGK
jgi:restriction system protein